MPLPMNLRQELVFSVVLLDPRLITSLRNLVATLSSTTSQITLLLLITTGWLIFTHVDVARLAVFVSVQLVSFVLNTFVLIASPSCTIQYKDVVSSFTRIPSSVPLVLGVHLVQDVAVSVDTAHSLMGYSSKGTNVINAVRNYMVTLMGVVHCMGLRRTIVLFVPLGTAARRLRFPQNHLPTPPSLM